MEHVCARCTRLGLRSKTITPSTSLSSSIRTFSTSRISYDEGDQKPSSSSPPPRGQPLPGSELKVSLNRNATSTPGARRVTPRPGNVLVRKIGGPRTSTAASAGGEGGTATATGSRAPTPARLIQRTGTGTGTGSVRPGPGQVLTRSAGAGRGQGHGHSAAQRYSPRDRSQAQSQSRGGPPPAGGKRTDKRVRRLAQKTATALAEEEDPSVLAANDLPSRVDNYINTIVDPPANPTTELPHVPGSTLAEPELRKDWPNTPLSTHGLVESVQQRIEWLAHRLPHGYQTPGQLAQHYASGNLTRFETAAERDEVLGIAKTLAQKWADRDTEKKEGGQQTVVEPEDMTFDDVVSRSKERDGLANTWARGVYPEVTKQKMPFLDQIVRNLGNNSSVTKGKMEAFMQTVQSVIVSRQQGQQQGGQAQKSAAK